MKVSTIGNEMIKTRPAILKRPANRLATAVLGLGLLFAPGTLKAHELKQDVLQKEAPVMIVSDAETGETSTDNSFVGGLLFGGMILAYMGACWIGDRHHDKFPKYPR